ncbi:YlbE-like family protein [Allocoprobacillus halotolerans]|uniref:YlbE-like family protein n=1 Tax=Allocoprobacillus halotolerans TaxID=2944914 RepID=A0ABY5I4F9_9FIRM|nr:YlbE-like family protein [Allocoprobacillus halotolerans]UTY38837.1 YlbE-like family protein [Allocoprobacillus halotolerans]
MMINDELRQYLRLHPKWYLILSRYPQEFPALIQQYKVENKMTFADRIERVGTLLQMLDMLL